MIKSHLLKLLERSMETEDRAVTQIAGDISSALEWYECTPSDKSKIKQMLSSIGNDSKDHVAVLSKLKGAVESSDKDEF